MTEKGKTCERMEERLVFSSPPAKKQRLNGDGNAYRVACFGDKRSLTQLAAHQYFEGMLDQIEMVGCNSMEKVVDALWEENGCDLGVIPIESSTGGVLDGAYEQLVGGEPVEIVAEFYKFDSLAWCSKYSLEEVKTVVCHPHLLRTCSQFLDSLDARRQTMGVGPIERVGVANSGFACMEARNASSKYPKCSAIVGETAATAEGIPVVHRGVANDRNAETRYLVVGKPNVNVRAMLPASNTDACKTSIAISLKNVAGSLFKMTSCFGLRDVDILRIESRPGSVMTTRRYSISTPIKLPEKGAYDALHKHWSLVFFIDFGTPSHDVMDQLLRNLKDYAIWVRVFGTYKSGLGGEVQTELSTWDKVVDNGIIAL